jgi:hypothetical protein
MAVENLTGTVRTTSKQHGSPGMGCDTKTLIVTVEVTAAASATSTYKIGRLPSNARITDLAKLYFDDLASSGAPTLDIGVVYKNSAGATVTDDDAIKVDVDAATAVAAGTVIIGDIANYGKRLWELAGISEDPVCNMDLLLTIKDADTNTGGTVTAAWHYFVD